MDKVRFATIGSSNITEKFLQAAEQTPGFDLTAVYSRSMSRAAAFGEKYGITKAYDSLDALAADEGVDAVYIATPNALHCEQTVRMLRAGKHVLCEKPLAANAAEAKLMIETARRCNRVLLEATRNLFDPGFTAIREHLGALGNIRRAAFSFSKYSSRYDAFRNGELPNIFNPALAAGALMDIGIYCVEPMLALFGKPRRIRASAVLLEGGIDGLGAILADYDSMAAELSYSKITTNTLPSRIEGEEGTMLISEIASPRRITIVLRDGRTQEIQIPGNDNNMCFEVSVFIEAVNQKRDISEYQQVSLDALQLTDEARGQIGVSFPSDKPNSEETGGFRVGSEL